MNNKKIYDIKLIKTKRNDAMVLIEEVQNLVEGCAEVETAQLSEALDDLEQQYYEIEDIQD